MANIRIALTNLGKYNEGELLYTWLELPATDDEIAEAFAEIKVAPNTRYEEHFITDYEAPFSISEYESITNLNEMAEQLDAVDFPERGSGYDAGDVINFAVDLENEGIVPSATEHTNDIITDEMLDDLVAHQAQDGGWQRVAHFIGGIEFMNDDYYYMNGYGNMENLDSDLLDGIVDDLLDEMKRNLSV